MSTNASLEQSLPMSKPWMLLSIENINHHHASCRVQQTILGWYDSKKDAIEAAYTWMRSGHIRMVLARADTICHRKYELDTFTVE